MPDLDFLRDMIRVIKGRFRNGRTSRKMSLGFPLNGRFQFLSPSLRCYGIDMPIFIEAVMRISYFTTCFLFLFSCFLHLSVFLISPVVTLKFCRCDSMLVLNPDKEELCVRLTASVKIGLTMINPLIWGCKDSYIRFLLVWDWHSWLICYPIVNNNIKKLCICKFS